LAVDFWFSVRAKLDRADEHLDAFNRETKGWSDSDQLTITRESDTDGREHIFRISYETPPDTIRWALLLGDAFHNLRGALDHAVYALAVANTRKNPPDNERKLAFPITTEPGLFKDAKWRIRSLSDPAQAAIERLQPYNRLKPGQWFMPLWWLSVLHDVDKHRLSHITTLNGVPDELAIDARPGTYEVFWNTSPHVDGAPILRLILANPNPNVYVDLHVTSGVVFNIEGKRPVRPFSLYWITRHIRREVGIACRYLALHLPEPPPEIKNGPALRMEDLAPGAE
jgi:hypothetical protein